jgi:hypothetical protein
MFRLWAREAAKKRRVGEQQQQQESTEVSSVESAADYQRVMRETWAIVTRVMNRVEGGVRDIREVRLIAKEERDRGGQL